MLNPLAWLHNNLLLMNNGLLWHLTAARRLFRLDPVTCLVVPSSHYAWRRVVLLHASGPIPSQPHGTFCCCHCCSCTRIVLRLTVA
jgi:hypothetical protein